MTVRSVRVLSCIALFALSSWQGAMAAERGIYAGVSYNKIDNKLGQGEFDVLTSDILVSAGFRPGTNTTSFDQNDQSYGFAVGYRLFDHLALEGSYMSLGTTAYHLDSEGQQFNGPATATVSLSTRSKGLAFSVLGILPVGYRWEFYGRAGALFASNRFSFFLRDRLSSLAGETSKNSTNYVAGAGLGYTLAEIYRVRAEYQRVFDVRAEQVGVKNDVDLLSIGVTVQF